MMFHPEYDSEWNMTVTTKWKVLYQFARTAESIPGLLCNSTPDFEIWNLQAQTKKKKKKLKVI